MLTVVALVAVASLQTPAPIRGFPSSMVSDQVRRERTARLVPNPYSPDGDVTAQLVYVNYGVPEDYRVLDSLGISVRGKIVIARYGRSWRGIKPKVAAEHGAIGCLIYSDPRDDGYWVGDVYPSGSMRPWQGVQRGSVMDMPTYPGDPLTPGWGSVPGTRRLPLAEARTLEPIPVLPISYGDAQPLLKNLAGPGAPEGWGGVGRRGVGPARLDRMGRGARRRAARQGRRLLQLRHQRKGMDRRRGVARPGAVLHRTGPRRDPARGPRRRERARRVARPSTPRAPARHDRRHRAHDRRPGLRLRLHGLPRPPRPADGQPRVRRGVAERHLPLDLRHLDVLRALPRLVLHL